MHTVIAVVASLAEKGESLLAWLVAISGILANTVSRSHTIRVSRVGRRDGDA
jgi:hypothetical protein